MTEPVSILFFGSGTFAVPVLRALLRSDSVTVAAVVTQPDKPAGRKKQLQPVPVKQMLLKEFPDISIVQPERFRDESDGILARFEPDLIIVADYGQILRQETLDAPRYGSLNVHASLLPRWRGAVPIQMAILHGDRISGVTIMRMTAGLDEGPIIAQREVAINDDDTAETLEARLAEQGSHLLLEVIQPWIDGALLPREQDDSNATVCSKADLAKDNAMITIDDKPDEIQRMVRAYYPWPVAWMEVIVRGQRKRLKIFSVSETANASAGDPGAFIKEGRSLLLNFTSGTLRLDDIQLEGLRRMPGSDYLFLADSPILMFLTDVRVRFFLNFWQSGAPQAGILRGTHGRRHWSSDAHSGRRSKHCTDIPKKTGMSMRPACFMKVIRS
ncbi:MAG: Methionyl-tRNA formyltransferase [candidate division WS6 bacterium OLB20]|uniref:Methionyl-tRNA formyltransferase n=1 Tax=candidate division WS6 bacterium OLB20 TaxID=1617426 RepID=A0A136LVZ9_9BACT|nr:MAG: Methionyl-tRNA formyltransferase [candidate division WS6 bacterium OLB20]